MTIGFVPHRQSSLAVGVIFSGNLEVSAYQYRKPEKYSFTLLFRNERVFALDVRPGLAHTNKITLETVFGTHWQT